MLAIRMTCSILTPGSLSHTVRIHIHYPLPNASLDAFLSERYVQAIVNRYKDSPTIFAWELMNEARCLGDLPGGPNCVPGTDLLNHWYKQQADFVRSLYVKPFSVTFI